jgi:hypothetical protein
MKLILENWRKFLIEQEEQEEIKATTNDIPDEMYHATRPLTIQDKIETVSHSQDKVCLLQPH